MGKTTEEKFKCPKCEKAFLPPAEKRGLWNVYNPVIKCPKCKKVVSRAFFLWMVDQNKQFKRSRTAKIIANIKGTKPKRAKDVVNPKVIDPKSEVKSPETGLTFRQEMFCLEYLLDFNATKAAIRAGYSEKTARKQATRLLTNVGVQRYLSVLKEEMKKRRARTADEIRAEMEKIAFTNITDVIEFNRDGLTVLKESGELSEDAKAALESVQFTENMSGISVKVKMRDKIVPLKILGQDQGIFKESAKDLNVTVETYEQRRKRLLGR